MTSYPQQHVCHRVESHIPMDALGVDWNIWNIGRLYHGCPYNGLATPGDYQAHLFSSLTHTCKQHFGWAPLTIFSACHSCLAIAAIHKGILLPNMPFLCTLEAAPLQGQRRLVPFWGCRVSKWGISLSLAILVPSLLHLGHVLWVGAIQRGVTGSATLSLLS